MTPINIIIADDHQMFIDGLTALLRDAPDMRILASAANGVDAIKMVESHPDADLLIMDISMPIMNGIQAAKYLRKSRASIRILALTQNADSGSISRAIKAGVAGYVIKTARKEEFLNAIRTVVAGETYFNAETTQALISSLGGKQNTPAGDLAPLSEREKEILKLIACEFTTNEIAARLFISPYTVETHRKNLIHKLAVRNTAGLVKMAIQYGLLDEE